MPRVFEDARITAARTKFDLFAFRKKTPQVQKPLANKEFYLKSISLSPPHHSPLSLATSFDFKGPTVLKPFL